MFKLIQKSVERGLKKIKKRSHNCLDFFQTGDDLTRGLKGKKRWYDRILLSFSVVLLRVYGHEELTAKPKFQIMID